MSQPPPAYSSQNPFPSISSVSSIASSLPPYSSQPPPNMPPLPPNLAAQQPLITQRMPSPPQPQVQVQLMQPIPQQQQLRPMAYTVDAGSIHPGAQVENQAPLFPLLFSAPQVQYQIPAQAHTQIYPQPAPVQQYLVSPPGSVPYSPQVQGLPQTQLLVQLPPQLNTHGDHLHYFTPGQIPGVPMVPGGTQGQTPGFQGWDRAPIPFNGPPRTVQMVLPGETEPTEVLLPGIMPDGTIGPYAKSGG